MINDNDDNDHDNDDDDDHERGKIPSTIAPKNTAKLYPCVDTNGMNQKNISSKIQLSQIHTHIHKKNSDKNGA